MQSFILRKIVKYSLLIIGAATLIAALVLWVQMVTQGQATLNCSAAYTIDETLPSGARWQMCWEHRALDGIVYRDVHFTPPNGAARRVLFQASIAQVHVPYDDNSARFHDITDDGFGSGNLMHLSAAECPNGRLLRHGSKNALCLQVIARGPAYLTRDDQQPGHALSLFSVSASGEYNYIPQWRFLDDGTIEPSMGATGKLQRFGTDPRYGWPVRANGTTGISHIHNYYWRLDFDLGAESTDDVFEEIHFTPNSDGTQRTRVMTPLTKEAGRTIDRATMRSWRIRDAAANADGHALSYHLEPLHVGHHDVGPSFEPFTASDIYVTRARLCERYVSHNPTTGGCGDDVSDFANGESLTGADLVLWYGISFHHIPRDEDELLMPAHWDGFQLVPRDWTATNPLAQNTPTSTPTFTPTFTLTPTLTPTPTHTPTLTPTATPPACQRGDTTCDGVINGGDALYILQYAAGKRPGNATVPVPDGALHLPACDVNDDHSCDAADARLILECTVGLANAFCPDGP